MVDNNDPKGWCRVRARVPFIFDGIPDNHLPWAIAQFNHEDGAGPGSGTQYVPKVGTKVLLHFQDGDENSPIWEGYTVDKTTVLQEMAHNYPDRKVTRLSNKALVVVDTKSNEVFIRHPGTTRIYIEGNCELQVRGDLTEHVYGNKTSFIDGNKIEVVKGSNSLYVQGDDGKSVMGSSTQLVGANYQHSVSGSSARVTGGSAAYSVGGSDSYSVGGSHTRSASRIDDNQGGAVSAPVAPTVAPAAPDLNSWPGIDGGAPGAFLMGFALNAAPVDVATSIGEDEEGPVSAEGRAAYEKAGIKLNADGTAVEGAPKPNPTDTDSKEPPANAAVPTSCEAFKDQTTFSPTMRLSDHFTLGDLSTNTLLERSAVRAQAGLTAAQIVCNLMGLAVNMLEPLTAKYGRPNINCGFRPSNASYGSPTGWHLKGAAADLQWAGISDKEYYERAVWIKDNLPFSEVILEYGGNRPWIHVAFQASSQSTTNFKTRVGVPSRYIKGILALTNKPGVGAV